MLTVRESRLFTAVYIDVEDGHEVDKKTEAGQASRRSQKVGDCNSDNTRWFDVTYLTVHRGFLDGAADEEEFEDGGHLEKAHYHVEVVCNDSCLHSKFVLMAEIVHTLHIKLHEGGVVDDTRDDNDAGADVEHSQWDQSDLPLLDHNAVEVVADEAEDAEVENDCDALAGVDQSLLGGIQIGSLVVYPAQFVILSICCICCSCES